LDFQPYFTATASNVGYTWWSHDIGGHKFGYRDDELMVRWMQFGVFSPINRLHSMSSPFYVKEPWLFGPEAGKLMIEALQLRHKMIPYIYTFNWRCHNDLIPVIVPTYYYYPNSDEAYEFKNQYFFGSELMVCPITKKSDNKTGMASVEAWIPEGIWTDLFTGFVYHGGKKTVLNRTLANEPVLAKAGAVVPMAKHIAGDNSTDNPENMEIYVFPGASNCFELYEDESDGFGYQEGKYALTKMDMKWSGNKAEFTLKPQGCLSILPSKRTYSIIFRGFNDTDAISVNVPYSKSYSKDTHSIVLDFEPLKSAVEIAIKIEGERLVYDNHDLIEHVFNLLVRAQIDYLLKNTIYNCFLNSSDSFSLIASLNALNLEKPLYDALLELIVC
jgi:alpha-glucosidase (family GH31 glycosyl hydrolase)